ncbi:hypothetical protein ACF044_11440 [Microbacterium sp. NPDC016588]
MEHQAAVPARRVGRPCAVCALPAQQRERVEIALAEGTSISSIARQHGGPGRDSIRHHLDSGHLRQDLQSRAERALGLDYTTVIARVSDIAQRARQTALEAREAGDRTGVLRAGDSELRALSVLVGAGESSEIDIARRGAYRDTAVALVRVARRDAHVGEAVADELDRMHRPVIAEDLREQSAPESRIEIES